MSSRLAPLLLKLGKSALLQRLPRHSLYPVRSSHIAVSHTWNSFKSDQKRQCNLQPGTRVTSLSASNFGTGYPVPHSDKFLQNRQWLGSAQGEVLTLLNSKVILLLSNQRSSLGKDLCSPTRTGCLLPPARTVITYRSRCGLPRTILCPKKNQHILTRGSVTH